jgi:hypothetical protein
MNYSIGSYLTSIHRSWQCSFSNVSNEVVGLAELVSLDRGLHFVRTEMDVHLALDSVFEEP